VDEVDKASGIGLNLRLRRPTAGLQSWALGTCPPVQAHSQSHQTPSNQLRRLQQLVTRMINDLSQAIDPLIGHLNSDHRMVRCHLKGSVGDALYAVLFSNIRCMLRMIVKKGLGLLLYLLQVSDLAGLFEKLAEIFGLKRL